MERERPKERGENTGTIPLTALSYIPVGGTRWQLHPVSRQEKKGGRMEGHGEEGGRGGGGGVIEKLVADSSPHRGARK